MTLLFRMSSAQENGRGDVGGVTTHVEGEPGALPSIRVFCIFFFLLSILYFWMLYFCILYFVLCTFVFLLCNFCILYMYFVFCTFTCFPWKCFVLYFVFVLSFLYFVFCILYFCIFVYSIKGEASGLPSSERKPHEKGIVFRDFDVSVAIIFVVKIIIMVIKIIIIVIKIINTA